MRIATAMLATFIGLGVNVALADSGAGSAGSSGAAGPEPAATQSPEEHVYCVKLPPPTGSHLGDSKECHTHAEWDRVHNKVGDAMKEYFEQDRIRAMQNQSIPATGSGR